MNKRIIGLAAAVIVLAAALVIFVRSKSGPAGETGRPATTRAAGQVVLRLAYRPRALTDVSPVIIAETSSIRSDAVRVELVPVATAQEGFARFNAGEVDGLAGMPLEATFAQMTGGGGSLNFRAYAVSVDQPDAGWVAIVASKSSGVTTLAGLDGKPVASLPTDQANWLLRKILAKAGLKVDPSKVVRYTPTNPTAGLRAGEVAAIFGPEPGNAMAVAEGGVVLIRGPISSMLYGGRPVPITASIVKTAFIESHPEAYSAFLGMIDQAIAQTKDHPETVRDYFGRETYGALNPDVRHNLELPVMMRPDDKLAAVARDFVADLQHDGLLPAAVDSDKLLLGKP